MKVVINARHKAHFQSHEICNLTYKKAFFPLTYENVNSENNRGKSLQILNSKPTNMKHLKN